MIGGIEPLHLSVGPEELEVKTLDGRFTEKKVPLPRRWLRGFAEAQVLAAGMALRAEVPAGQAAAVLRALPRPVRRSAARTTRWMVPVGGALRPVSRPGPGAVCLPGAERLSVLRPVLRHATAARVCATAGANGEPAAVAWELRLPGMRLVLMLSQDAHRGFSGEGGVLGDLAAGPAEKDAADLLAALSSEVARVDVAGLSLEEWRPVIERNLERLRGGVTGQPHGRNLDRWETLVGQGDVLSLHRVLTGLDRDSIEMLEVSPMSGLLPQDERQAALQGTD